MYDAVALAHWHRQFAWQANLNHALHETEQMARRVSAVEAHDPFAAMVLARDWLTSIRGLGANNFPDLYSKRAITEAIEYLQRAANSDPQAGYAVSAYAQAMDRMKAFQAQLGSDPQAAIRVAASRRDSVGFGLPWIGVAAFWFICFIGSRGNGVFLVFAIGCLVPVGQAYAARSRASAEVERVQGVAQDYQSFMSAPSGGGWLQRQWHEHRLLFEPPPAAPVSARAVSSVVERQVVERQIVVTRCKYCRQLTPVDRATCEHCGAAGFGSSQG